MDVCNSTSADNFNNISELARLRLTNASLQEENDQLRAEVNDLNTQVQQYKLVSQSFEMRVLDLQTELKRHDEEVAAATVDTDASKKFTKSVKRNGQRPSGADNASHYRDDNDENGSEPEQFRKLFIGGLSYTTTDQSLREYFSKFGEIVDCIVMKDATTKRSRGFGFVVYAKVSMVDDAQNGRPHVVDDREVETKRAVPKGDQVTDNQLVTKKVFVGGLRDSTDEAGLKAYFSQFGKVDHIDMIEDRTTKRMRGFAYVSFLDYDPVDKAVLQKFHTIDGRRCEVKKAMSKIMMKNKICASVGGGGGNNGIGGGQQGWNGNSFWGPSNYETIRGAMCGNGGLMNMMGSGGGGGRGVQGGINGNDYNMGQMAQGGGRHMCSAMSQCSAGNWNSPYCGGGGGAGGGYHDMAMNGVGRAVGGGNQCRSHEHSQKNGGRGSRNNVPWNYCANGDGITSPNDFTSD